MRTSRRRANLSGNFLSRGTPIPVAPTQPAYKQVVYLHYLPLEKPLHLGPFVLWPYNRLRSKRIANPQIRQHLNRLFRQMLDSRGRPLKTIAVLSPDVPASFQPSSDETAERMRNAVDALFLSSVIKNNSVTGAVSRENFQLVTQNFQPGSDDWATEDGSYIRTTVGGLKLKDAGIRLPGHVPRPGQIIYDEKLLEGLLKCLVAASSASRDRIFRAIRWISYAYSNAEGFPYQNRVLLLMIAFEILSDETDSFNRFRFGAWLDSIWGVSANEKFPLQQAWAKDKGPFGQAGWWGVEFFLMRNAIVHDGDPHRLGAHDSSGREYFATGVTVFAECVREFLRRENHLAPLSNSEEFSRRFLLTARECKTQTRP